MINRTMIGDDFLGLDSSMKGPVFTSAFFHVLLFIVTAVGLPFIARDHELLSRPISVEVVTPDQISQTNRVAAPVKPKEEELPPPKQEKPSPPKMAEEAPPDLSKPKPPEIKEEVKAPPVEQLAPPKPEKKKQEVKPKEKPKLPKQDVTKVEKKTQEQDFQSLLKNLTPDAKEENPVESPQTAKDSAQGAQIATLADRLTMSEMDALRHQLAGCWNVMAGAKFAEDLVVEVRVIVNRDRTVQQATILDQGRYNRDSHFRAAADAALRALRNPQCAPLALPPDKYNEWKTTVIRFDPSEML